MDLVKEAIKVTLKTLRWRELQARANENSEF